MLPMLKGVQNFTISNEYSSYTGRPWAVACPALGIHPIQERIRSSTLLEQSKGPIKVTLSGYASRMRSQPKARPAAGELFLNISNRKHLWLYVACASFAINIAMASNNGAQPVESASLWSRDNLIPWSAVHFDSKERRPRGARADARGPGLQAVRL